jgi:transcriptional regulator with XRE-family HTH domain
MTNIRELLASNIKTYRAARGWSQAKLAEKTGTSTQYIGMIETKIKFPSSKMLHKLAKALEIDPSELFYKEIDPETTMKNAQKAVIKDFGEAFCRLITGFVAEKVSEMDENSMETGEGKPKEQ